MAQTHDIEDVLSSIRRLVASDSSAVPRRETAPETPALVLAEEQRVVEPEDPFQMIRNLAQEERDGRDAVHFTNALPEEVAEITHDLDAEKQANASVAPEETGSEEAASGDEYAGEAEIEPTLAGDDDSPDLWDDRGDAVPADMPRDYAEDADFEEAADDHHIADDIVDAAPQAEPMPEMAETVEPVSDVPSADASSGEMKVDLTDLSGAMQDDEALRDLIAEIVRQELSGELGERITRNVRKLVRREIRQMLASEEFD